VFLLVLCGNFVLLFKETIMFKTATFLLGLGLFLFACSPNNVKSDPAIVKIMDSASVTGVFALMENGSGQFIITNLAAYKDSAYAPLNTFFALPTLLALDKGVISHDAKTWISLDSVRYYEELIAKLGREAIVKTRDSLRYGKGIMSADSTQYWNNGSLLITPDEQLGFIKKLYFNELSFQKRSQEMYKKMILREDNTNYKLSYINGFDSAKGKTWYLGYVEENKHPYFFVFYTKSIKSNSAINDQGALLKTILLQQGFLKGVR
jgi:beta-lactamase class D